MKTIVVLGVGLSAALVIRQVMRTKVLPSKDYKMIVISPNTHFQWPIAMPRAVVPGQINDDKIFIPLEPIFKEYPSDKFEFVVGKASALHPDTNTVVVDLTDSGATRSVMYDALVIATGAGAKGDVPWKGFNGHAATLDNLRTVQRDIKNAKTIVVGGGGFTGVETAGELGFEYAKDGKKEVYFIHDQAKPFSDAVLDGVRNAATNELKKLKVKIIANTKITNVTRSGNDTVLELRNADGTTKTLTTQAYLSATGVVPNSGFAPPSMLDARGYLNQDKHLRATGHKNIFVSGDVGNLENKQAMYAEAQAAHLMKALPLFLDGAALPEYVPDPKPIFAVTTGRSRGTGQMGGFKLFSIMVWFLKGRTMGTDAAPLYAAGKKTIMKKYE